MPETRQRESSSSSSASGGGQLQKESSSSNNNSSRNNPDAPSGFILKLFQMVNGAPDEVIKWNKVGDAFIIGNDIEKLESETLPQYFRHNRFQSLVRQLNFYSFRKINKERSVWIYRHTLFHRDRPEDLKMVRRRTCSNGVNRRKQRLSRDSSRKLADNHATPAAASAPLPNTTDEDESSSLEACNLTSHGKQKQSDKMETQEKTLERESSTGSKSKREIDLSVWTENNDLDKSTSSSNKRGRVSPVNVKLVVEKQVAGATDSILTEATTMEKFNSSSTTDAATASQTSDPVDERVEMVQQSLVVSQVAMKLEKLARKAYGPTTETRPRRSRSGVTGVVTPPFGTSRPPSTSLDLLTYDDEYDGSDDFDDVVRHSRRSSMSPNTGAVSDGDESTTAQDYLAAGLNMVTPDKPKDTAPSKIDYQTAEAINERIEGFQPDSRFSHDHIVAGIVARFAMHTSPINNVDLGETMYWYLEQNSKLRVDFELYREALSPYARTKTLTLKQVFSGDAIRSDAIRDFKTFTVNCLDKILGKNGDIGIAHQLLKSDRDVLERRANVWRMAAAM